MLFLCCLPFSLKFTFTPKIYTFGCKIFDLGKSKGFLFLHLLETQGSLEAVTRESTRLRELVSEHGSQPCCDVLRGHRLPGWVAGVVKRRDDAANVDVSGVAQRPRYDLASSHLSTQGFSNQTHGASKGRRRRLRTPMAVLLLLLRTADSIHTVDPEASDQSTYRDTARAASLARAHANNIKSTAPAKTTSWQLRPEDARSSKNFTSAKVRAGALFGGGAFA